MFVSSNNVCVRLSDSNVLGLSGPLDVVADSIV